MPLLQVDRVRVNYGAIPALIDVNLEVGAGEIVALLGPNGAGKSTLLKAIGGLLPVSSGSITFGDAGEHQLHRLHGDQIARRGVSLVPEGRGIFPALSVEDNLLMGGYRAGDDFDARLAMVTAYFPILAQRHGQAAASLSGGEQQQLAIARALMARPRLLMLDEMSLGLAPRVVAELFTVLRKINADGCAVLLVEQQVPQALAVADRVYVLERGRINLSGSSSEMAADVARLSQAYLGGGERQPGSETAGAGADLVELERFSIPLSHHDKRMLQTLADAHGETVGEYVGRLLAAHVAAAQTRRGAGEAPNGRKISPPGGVSSIGEVAEAADVAPGLARPPDHVEVHP